MTLFFYSPTIPSLTKVNEHIEQNYEFLGSRETMKPKAAMYGGAGRGGQDDFILERAEDSVLRKLAHSQDGVSRTGSFQRRVGERVVAPSDGQCKQYIHTQLPCKLLLYPDICSPLLTWLRQEKTRDIMKTFDMFLSK